jgi:hypothetical protein
LGDGLVLGLKERWLELNGLYQFLALFKPGHRVD